MTACARCPACWTACATSRQPPNPSSSSPTPRAAPPPSPRAWPPWASPQLCTPASCRAAKPSTRPCATAPTPTIADPAIAALGQRLFHLGPARDRDVFETLKLIEVGTPEDADFLLNTGPDDHLGPDDPTVYTPTLNAALAAGLPMLCANPDLEVMRAGQRIICAGLLAQIYAAQGGAVIMRGKPDPAIYAPTLALLGTAKSRTLAIGDSLRTDIAGAQAAGIDSCWVLSGIHAANPPDAAAQAAAAGLTPRAILPGFAW